MTTPTARTNARTLVRHVVPLLLGMALAPGGASAQEAPATRRLTIPGTTVGIDLVRLPVAPGGESLAAEGPALDADGAPLDTDGAPRDAGGPAHDADGAPLDTDGPALWMSRTEITWDVFDVFVYGLDQPAEQPAGADGTPVHASARPTRPYIAVDRGFGHAGYAALSVSIDNARAFCAWLSERTGVAVRLPGEAEWEAACRAGADDCNPDANTLREHAWFRGNARYKAQPVATRAANAWGLHDLAGNVAEWVEGRDGVPVVKGGSYLDGLSDNSCARRRPFDPAWNASDPNLPKSRWWLADGGFIGFRVVCEGEPRGPAVR